MVLRAVAFCNTPRISHIPHIIWILIHGTTAKDVIALNHQGLGFSRTGWLGPFVNAWSIDGTLNADFIRAGKIRAAIFESSFNSVGDLLRMVSGTLQLWNGNKKNNGIDA